MTEKDKPETHHAGATRNPAVHREDVGSDKSNENVDTRVPGTSPTGQPPLEPRPPARPPRLGASDPRIPKAEPAEKNNPEKARQARNHFKRDVLDPDLGGTPGEHSHPDASKRV